MDIYGAKFQEHCFNNFRDIVYSVFTTFQLHVVWHHHWSTLHNRKTSISLKRKKIFQKEKRHSSLFWKAFQISRKKFLCHIHFNDWSRGEQWILFPENLNVSRDETKQKQNLKTALRFQRTHATAVNISRVTVNCFPFDVIVFAMLPTHGIWRETVSLLDIMWPWTNQWIDALLRKKRQLYNNVV